MKLQTGTLLERGKYRIIDSLGRGGFGITYLAEQVMAKRKVCIKEFFPKDYYKRDGDTSALILSSDGFAETMDKYKAKFIKEAQTIAALEHTSIIHIFDVFEENGTAYYVMEYIEGESLSNIVKQRGALAEAKAVAYIRQVAAALEYIHHRQIMHLDVKPGNIMVRRDDDRAILIDFGLSKHYDDKSGEATSTTPVGVSHGFAPMEQYQQGGVKEFSPETDIYSLAASLYYLATGDMPPQAANIADEGLPELPSHLSSGVRNAIERSMETQRKRRPHSIGEFLTLLGNDKKVVVPIKEPIKEETVIDVQRPAANTKTSLKPPQAEPMKEQPTPMQPKKKTKWWKWLLLAIVIGGFCNFLASRGERKETTGPYEVGDYYNENGKEGVVFEVWAGGYHGKIVSLDEAQLPWCTDGNLGKFVESSLTIEGKVNTDKVMSLNDEKGYPAFTWCREKGDDWYLPATSELKTIYKNKSAINATLTEYGEELKSYRYWSSTQGNENRARFVYMGDGRDDLNRKTIASNVRAVSTF